MVLGSSAMCCHARAFTVSLRCDWLLGLVSSVAAIHPDPRGHLCSAASYRVRVPPVPSTLQAATSVPMTNHCSCKAFADALLRCLLTLGFVLLLLLVFLVASPGEHPPAHCWLGALRPHDPSLLAGSSLSAGALAYPLWFLAWRQRLPILSLGRFRLLHPTRSFVYVAHVCLRVACLLRCIAPVCRSRDSGLQTASSNPSELPVRRPASKAVQPHHVKCLEIYLVPMSVLLLGTTFARVSRIAIA